MTQKCIKIAVLFEADLDNRKGMTNAIINRIKHICDILPVNVEVYPICISEHNGSLARRLRRKQKKNIIDSIYLDSIKYQILWKKFSIIDYLLEYKVSGSPLFDSISNRSLARQLSGYDLISAHSFVAGRIANEVKQMYNTPYVVTWHGSDIHSQPYQSSFFRRATIKILN